MKSRFLKPTLALLLVLGIGLAFGVRTVSTAPLILDWRVIGTGTAGGTCQLGPLASGCGSNSSGSALGTHIGSSTYTLSVTAGPSASFNSLGGACFPAVGTSDVTAANGAVINLNVAGWLCEEGLPGSPYHYNGTYRIVSGTDRFGAVVGGGNLTATFEKGAAGVSFIKIDGTINF